ncbi:MAG: heme-copper oxidase subunit III [Candidatus Peribacteraceae bacterium]|jgi:cytochrome c oxidase subunit 3|nr:heme-copper oxidase subunit III [Candidatus Peribacteraceae bacterium]|tara:strand:+ start:4225 stop:4824 length:600 start_codon:yes stop_codon:yes gene_type:complete
MNTRTLAVQQPIEPSKTKDEFTSYLGLLIGLASITMLFVTLLISYSILRIQAGYWFVPGGGSSSMSLAIVNTMILLASSGTWVIAARKTRHGRIGAFRRWTWATVVLGVLFLISQLVLWQFLTTKGFTVQSSIVGSVFYMLTGMHGLHILAGLAALVWILVKVTQDNFVINRDRVRLVGVFWHFLDVLWICLFTAIFIL